MITVLWCATLVAILAGYGMIRGFSADICKKVVLMACGAAIAALGEIGGVLAWLLIALLCLVIFLLCFVHDTPRHRSRTPPQGATPRRRRQLH